MSLAGRDIVCLSSHYWDERWFRKQEFMSRFAARNRVLYVEPTFSMVRGPEEHRREVATNRLLRPRIERRGERLWLYKLPRGLPKWSDPRIERATYSWFARLLQRTCRQLGFDDPIFWLYYQSWLHGLHHLRRSALVFDLVDDLAGYLGDHGTHIQGIEESLVSIVRQSDLLVATAQPLIEKYGELARHSVHIANGFSADRFDPAKLTGEAPADLAELPRPLIGFVGTLFRYLDFDLMEHVAEAHADKTLVLVGPADSDVTDRVERLAGFPNVRYLGPRAQPEIPAYIAAFDVCINVFRTSRVAAAVNPLKVYEYLAAGRPVVSTRTRALEMEDAARVISFADSPEEFARQVDHCLATSSQQAAEEERREAVRPYSWQALFERLDAACEAAVPR